MEGFYDDYGRSGLQPSGSQASPGAADASPPSVSIPNAVLAPMPDPKRVSAIARLATRGLDGLVGPPAWAASEVAARHGYLYGWYAALARAAELDAEELRAAASAMSARSAETEGLSPKDASAAPEGGDAQ